MRSISKPAGNPTTINDDVEVVGVSLDWDSTVACFLKTIPVRFPLVIEEKIIELLLAHPHALLVFFFGTARQSVHSDYSCAEKNENGLAFEVMPKLIEDFKDRHPLLRKQIKLCKLLSEDIIRKKSAGTYFKIATNNELSYLAKRHYNSPNVNRDSKNDLIDHQIGYLHFLYPQKRTIFVFIDDLLTENLIPLKNYFFKDSLPHKNIVLQLFHMKSPVELSEVASIDFSKINYKFIREFGFSSFISRAKELQRYYDKFSYLTQKKEALCRSYLVSEEAMKFSEFGSNFENEKYLIFLLQVILNEKNARDSIKFIAAFLMRSCVASHLEEITELDESQKRKALVDDQDFEFKKISLSALFENQKMKASPKKPNLILTAMPNSNAFAPRLYFQVIGQGKSPKPPEKNKAPCDARSSFRRVR